MDKLEKFSRIFKITLLRWLFSKMVSNLWFFEKFPRDFRNKIGGDFFNGISFENWRRFQKKIKGISFVKFYPRASLARAAFTLKLSLIPAIDLLPPCLWKVKSEKWSEVKWSEVKWSEKVKWSEIHFWSFKFFRFQICWGGGLG